MISADAEPDKYINVLYLAAYSGRAISAALVFTNEEEVSNEEVEEEVESESDEEEPKKPDPKPDSSSEEDGSDEEAPVAVQPPKVRAKSTQKQQQKPTRTQLLLQPLKRSRS
ncbi:hypothetical protein QQ045_002860 [Rhodiola kirilowii]